MDFKDKYLNEIDSIGDYLLGVREACEVAGSDVIGVACKMAIERLWKIKHCIEIGADPDEK